MKWIEAKIVFDHSDSDLPDSDLAADLISDVFFDLGLQGVAVDDPDIEPHEDWAEDAIARANQHAVIGYIHKDSQAEPRLEILESKLKSLHEKLGLFYRIIYKELDEQDWAHSWKAYFWPQKVGSRLVVKPTWREYKAEPDDIVVELDPGMAFGTGTHPTTALCLGMIEKHVRKGDSFLDVGTGSGILMIAAAKMGAVRLCGIDKDEVAIDVAAKNLELNRVNTRIFQLMTGNLSGEISDSYDFVAANIFTPVILELLKDLPRLLTPGGVFVCSGIIADNQNSVIHAMKDTGFEIFETVEKENWVAIGGRLQDRG
jgi:ribosomal protein L11 methyltransferase